MKFALGFLEGLQGQPSLNFLSSWPAEGVSDPSLGEQQRESTCEC